MCCTRYIINNLKKKICCLLINKTLNQNRTFFNLTNTNGKILHVFKLKTEKFKFC